MLTDAPNEHPTEVPTEVPAATTEVPAEELPMSFELPFFNTSSIYEDDALMAA
jgi:hypothetical protein